MLTKIQVKVLRLERKLIEFDNYISRLNCMIEKNAEAYKDNYEDRADLCRLNKRLTKELKRIQHRRENLKIKIDLLKKGLT